MGGVRDATGLIHVGARDYDPLLQRFTTVDPVLALPEPLHWNAYTYSENSPVTFSDPSGPNLRRRRTLDSAIPDNADDSDW